MLPCFSEKHSMWRRHSTGGGGANGYFILVLCHLALHCLLITRSTACSNGNCQVPLSLLISWYIHYATKIYLGKKTHFLEYLRSLYAILVWILEPHLQIRAIFNFHLWVSAEISWILQLLDSCASATDCGPSLYCGDCPELGKSQPFCIRGQAIEPTSIVSFFLTFFTLLCSFCFLSWGLSETTFLSHSEVGLG